MVQQPTGPSRLSTLLDLFAEPLVVVNGGREQVQRELIGPPTGGRSEPIQLGFELGRYTQVHGASVVGQSGAVNEPALQIREGVHPISTILGGATIVGNAAAIDLT
jgi:hypothetical protein